MDCTKVRKLFIGYIDNALNISDREKVDLHISMCSECRSEMEALAGVSEELRQAFHTATAGVSPSPNAWLNIKDQLYSKHGSEGFWDRIRARLETPRPVWQSGLVGVLAIIVICLVWFVPPVISQTGAVGDAINIAKNNPEVKALISGREISVQTAKIPDATGNTLYKVTFVYNTIPSELRTMETNSAQTKGAYSSLSSDSSGSYDNANQYNYLVNAIVNTKTSEVINIEQEYVPVLNESQKQIAIDMAKAADPRIGNNTTLVDVDVKALPVTVTVTNQHIPSIIVVVSFKAWGKSYQVTVDLTAQKVISVK